MKLDRALRKRAAKLESKKIESGPADIHALEVLLHDVFAIICPKPSDYKNRSDLVKTFDKLAKDKIRGTGNDIPAVEAFGSFIMDMFTSKSDLDLSINFARGADSSRDKQISILKKFSKVMYSLQGRGRVSGVTPILRARVPILKVVDRGTGVECDISVENRDGMMRSGILRIICSIDERFRKLCFLIKAWAAANNINSSKDRTLNSLSLILLVAFHFQTRSPPILPPFSALLKDGTDFTRLTNVVHGYRHFGTQNRESLAELFETLLTKLLSMETLWPMGICASTYEGCWITKIWDSGIGNMSVEDFTDRSQNCARAVGKIEVQNIYKCIRRSLDHISAFKNGKKQAADLKKLLFGPDAVISSKDQHTKNSQVTLKRNNPSYDAPAPPPNPAPIKRKRFTEDEGRRYLPPPNDITSHMAPMSPTIPRYNAPAPTSNYPVPTGRMWYPEDVGRGNLPLNNYSGNMARMYPEDVGRGNLPLGNFSGNVAHMYPKDVGRGNLPPGNFSGNMAHMYPPNFPPRPSVPSHYNHALPQPPSNFGGFHPNSMFPMPYNGPGHHGAYPPYPYGHG